MSKTLQDLVDLLRDYPFSISQLAMDWTIDDVEDVAGQLEAKIQEGSFY